MGSMNARGLRPSKDSTVIRPLIYAPELVRIGHTWEWPGLIVGNEVPIPLPGRSAGEIRRAGNLGERNDDDGSSSRCD